LRRFFRGREVSSQDGVSRRLVGGTLTDVFRGERRPVRGRALALHERIAPPSQAERRRRANRERAQRRIFRGEPSLFDPEIEARERALRLRDVQEREERVELDDEDFDDFDDFDDLPELESVFDDIPDLIPVIPEEPAENQVIFFPPRQAPQPAPNNQPLNALIPRLAAVPTVEWYRRGRIHASSATAAGGSLGILSSSIASIQDNSLVGANTATRLVYSVRPQSGAAEVSITELAISIYNTWREQTVRQSQFLGITQDRRPVSEPIVWLVAVHRDEDNAERRTRIPIEPNWLRGPRDAFVRRLQNQQANLQKFGDLVSDGVTYEGMRNIFGSIDRSVFVIYTPWILLREERGAGGKRGKNIQFRDGYLLRHHKRPVEGACFWQALQSLGLLQKPKKECVAVGKVWGEPVSLGEAQRFISLKSLDVGIVRGKADFAFHWEKPENFSGSDFSKKNLQLLELRIIPQQTWIFNPVENLELTPQKLIHFDGSHFAAVEAVQPYEHTCSLSGEDISPYVDPGQRMPKTIPLRTAKTLPSLSRILFNKGVLEKKPGTQEFFDGLEIKETPGKIMSFKNYGVSHLKGRYIQENYVAKKNAGPSGAGKKDERPVRYIFFDFETTARKSGLIKPWSVQAIMGKIEVDSSSGAGKFIAEPGYEADHIGFDAAGWLWDHVFTNWTIDDSFQYVAFGFNNSRFDNQLFMDYMVRKLDELEKGPKMLITDSAILTMTVGKVVVRDLLRLLGPTSLRNACKAFGTKTQKHEADHDEIQRRYVHFCRTEGTETPAGFIKSMKEDEAMRDYGMADVQCLAELAAILEAAWTKCCPHAGSILSQLTIAGAVFHAWRTFGDAEKFGEMVRPIGDFTIARWLRSGLVGGRCEISPEHSKTRVNWEEDKMEDEGEGEEEEREFKFPIKDEDLEEVFGDTVQSFDVKSLYPYAMKFDFPTGQEKSTSRYIPGKPGFYQVEMLRQPSPNIYPYRQARGVWEWQFQDCRYQDSTQPFTCIISNLEVETLQRLDPGCFRFIPRILQLGEAEAKRRYSDILAQWNLTDKEQRAELDQLDTECTPYPDPSGAVGIFWESSGPVFRDFLQGLENQKTEQDRLKEAGSSEYNPGVRGMAKLAMNSLSGKQIQRKFIKDTMLVSTLGALGSFEASHNNVSIAPIGDSRSWLLTGNRNRLSYRPWSKKRMEYPWHLGFFIYARARYHMYNSALLPMAADFKYTDTDSIHVPSSACKKYVAKLKESGSYSRGFGKFYLGGKFGDFEPEMEFPANQYLYLNKKCYFIQSKYRVRSCKKIFKLMMGRAAARYVGATEIPPLGNIPKLCLEAQCEHVESWRPSKRAWKGVQEGRSRFMDCKRIELFGTVSSPRPNSEITQRILNSPMALTWPVFKKMARGEPVNVVSTQILRKKEEGGRFAPMMNHVNWRTYLPPGEGEGVEPEFVEEEEEGEGKVEKEMEVDTRWWEEMQRDDRMDERREAEFKALSKDRKFFLKKIGNEETFKRTIIRAETRIFNEARAAPERWELARKRLTDRSALETYIKKKRTYTRELRYKQLAENRVERLARIEDDKQMREEHEW